MKIPSTLTIEVPFMPSENHKKKHLGVPKRLHFHDEPGKTRRFLLMTTIAWLGCYLAFFLLAYFHLYTYVSQYNGMLRLCFALLSNALLVATWSLPVIWFFAIVLKLMEKLF